jgi:hypothetical protein
MGQQNQKQQNPVKEEEDNDNNPTEVQPLKHVRRRLPLEMECEIFKFLQVTIQHKFIWRMGRGIYGMFGQKILNKVFYKKNFEHFYRTFKTKSLANPKGNGWRKSPGATISWNRLNVSNTYGWLFPMCEWHYIFAEKGFVISEAYSLNANFPRKIFYYFEVTQTTTQWSVLYACYVVATQQKYPASCHPREHKHI